MTFPVSRRALLIGALPVAALGLSACGSSQNSSSSSPSASPAASSASSSVSSAASSSAATEAGSSASASASDGYVGYRLNSEVPGAGTATLYTDYQCPYCAKAEPKFEEAAKKLDGVLNVTVRHMPLDIHANAVPAALAVQAAEAQGKHVEMANKVFSTQEDWKNTKDIAALRTLFGNYAKELGLDTDKFDKDLVDEKTLEIVKKDYDHALSIGVKGTPSFVVNDKVVQGLDSASSVDELIETFKREAGVK